MCLFLTSGTQGTTSFTSVIMIYIVLIALMYFLFFLPRKKEEKKKKELLDNLAIGDSVLTTAGFYGIIIDIAQDTVIVEFGNKNCRIHMQKAAIVSSEKPNFSKPQVNVEENK